jgi:hypothetical protein
MKKGALILLTFVLILSLFFASASSDTPEGKAYSCISSKITDKCASLSTEEKIFSVLSVNKCRTELVADASNKGCWPKSGCRIKTTAQAILALNQADYNISKSEAWLISQNTSVENIDWFLQVESIGESKETSCTASYSGEDYEFSINEDGTISDDAGSCLTKENYWLKIEPDCYNEQFDISCTDSFLTSLLYKKAGSSTFYISDKTNSASGEGTTSEKVKAVCFSDGDSCDYEGTLWASVILKYKGKDVSSFVPYLVSMADENEEYLPESFLYSLTNNFRTELLAKQTENWWIASGDKFYDTAVALFPFQNEESLVEKSNSKKWLEEVQGKDGCWQGNLRNTAFLLYSLWPQQTSEYVNESNQSIPYVPSTSKCENCMSKASCTELGGAELNNYTGCFGTNICCSKTKQIQSCAEQTGEICSSDEECSGGSFVSSSDSGSSKLCCIGGTCEVPASSGSECDINGGVCRSSCNSEEELASYVCPISGLCCTSKKTSINILVILILAGLIALVIIGIIFRRKISEFFLRFKRKGKPSSSSSGPRFPPTSSSRIYPGAVPRRIIPNPAQRTPMPARNKSEFDDVLKKLKDIGNK